MSNERGIGIEGAEFVSRSANFSSCLVTMHISEVGKKDNYDSIQYF
jgi:hypothetical protein